VPLNFRRRTSKPDAPEAERRSTSLSDPGLIEYLGLGGATAAGVRVTESTSLGLTAVWRAVSLLAGTVAALPLKTFRTLPDGSRERIASFLDNPGGPDGATPYEWKESVVAHLLLHGNAYLVHVYNGGGGLAGLLPIHPTAATVKQDGTAPGGKVFDVTLADGQIRTFTAADLTHVPGLSTDGLRGISPIKAVRDSLGTGIAGNEAAARIFANGLLIGGILSGDSTLDPEQGEELKARLKAKLSGPHNAGEIAVVNADVKFQPWTMSAEDAQFIESRAFQVEEVARIFGVPKVLLAEDGASTWGSGIAELLRGMARFTLAPLTTRIEERLSRLLPSPRFAEFDYAGLLQPSPDEVTQNMIAEIGAGLLTVDEGRRLLNRPPLNTTPPQEAAS
jgi:HK97 family phage portal protein